MLHRQSINHSHFAGVFDLHRRFDQSCEIQTLDHFVTFFHKVEGQVVVDGDYVAAAVYFSNFTPRTDIVVHCVSDPKYKGRWMNRGFLWELGEFVYGKLGLERMSGYSILGLTDVAEGFLLSIGFKVEGCKRRAAWVKGEYRDVMLYGLLKEGCRWWPHRGRKVSL